MAAKKTITSYKTALIWGAVVAAVLIGLMAGGAFAAIGYGRLYDGRIFPGVRVLGIRLDGLTTGEARETVNKTVDAALKEGIRFRTIGADGKSRDVSLSATTVATDPDASRDLVHYDIEPAVVAALSYGRGGNLLFDTLARWRARVSPVSLDAGTVIDEDGIRQALGVALQDAFPLVQDAALKITWNAEVKGADVTVIPEQAGRGLDVDPALRTLRAQAERLQFQPIEIRSREMKPAVLVADAERLKSGVPDLLSHAPFKISYQNKIYSVTPELLASWLGIVRDGRAVSLGIIPERFAAGIRKLDPTIEKTAKQGSLLIEDGKIKSFEAGTEGVAINDAATLSAIHTSWTSGSATGTYPLVVTRTEPALTGQDPERLGIREIIGVGHSNFSGSPTNRRKNIALGVNKVNGTLIAPGAEFSMLETLGPVTAENGWLPELVIKGNKTEPELGGGLCQIGTTTFRAALSSGLPITERRNHSYRVRYYEPAGTDATIYEPKPDFRFRNDTSHHVLIHAFIEGDDITYEFWGTEDGREAVFRGQKEVTSVDDLKPRVFNVTAPPETKLVETLDLKPGQKKCTEVAHAGADAEFTYKVTYGDGTVKEEVFRSHYRPWQAVCLVGVEKLSEPPPDASAPGSSDSAASDAAAIN